MLYDIIISKEIIQYYMILLVTREGTTYNRREIEGEQKWGGNLG
jgi:hypothetical protein